MTINRKKFIQNSAIAGTALLLNPFKSKALIKENISVPFGTHLKFMATSWGFQGSMDAFCAKVKMHGYNGIEVWWPNTNQEIDLLFTALKKYQLEVGFLVAGNEVDFSAHAATFKKNCSAAATNTIQKPLYINCHSGKDYFSFQNNKQLIDFTTALSRKVNIPILHETHRSRLLYSAPIARDFFNQIPDLRITLDMSHWCNVSESLLEDQQDTLMKAVERTDHIHARIGHQQGPQVNDPRAPEWAAAVKAHLDCWDRIAALKKQQGSTLTILTEFGPPNYMPTLPYTQQPVADQWEINIYMMNLLRNRYAV